LGLTVDFVFGIGLHFFLQAMTHCLLWYPHVSAHDCAMALGPGGRLNFVAKTLFDLEFLGDVTKPVMTWVLLVLLALVLWVVGRTFKDTAPR
jgi:hypothetical protein